MFKKKIQNEPEDRKYILQKESSFLMREAYTTLRTNILFSLPAGGCKVIAVTSAHRSEGKSTNCVNMAISFGQLGAKVLIIDCDLRRPNVNRLMEEKADTGLSNLLIGLCDFGEAVRKTKYENLDAIYAGEIPPNPTELLCSERMIVLMEALSKGYDYIFIDTPPVCVVSDAAILSKFVSGIVFVVKSGQTDRKAVADAVHHLEFSKTKILGYVLANLPIKGGKYGRYGRYKRNGYYLDENYGYYGHERQSTE